MMILSVGILRRPLQPRVAALALLAFLVGCSQPSPKPETAPIEDGGTLQAAADAIREERWAFAEEILRKRMIATPDNLEVGVLWVELLCGRGSTEEAANELLRLSRVHAAERHLLCAQAAELRFEMKRYDSAIAILRQVTAEQPHRHEIRSRLAEMLNARGLRHEANLELRFLAGRIRLTTKELIALINPMQTWVTFEDRPELSDREAILKAGALNVVAALRSRGEFRDALTVLSQSEEFERRLPAAIAMYGWMLAMNQDESSLRSWVASAPESARQYPAYWLAVGNLLLREDSSASIGCFIAALRLEPHCAEAIEGLAQAFQRQGQAESYQRARQHRVDLDEVRGLGRKLATTPDPMLDAALGIEMGRLLNALGCPIESLAWQETTIARVSPAAPQLGVLAAHKEKVLERLPEGHVESLTLVGVEPMPVRDLLMTVAEIASRSVDSLPPKYVVGDAPAQQNTLPRPETPVFVDIAEKVGINFRYQNAPVPVEKAFRLFESLGSGIACLDFDLDGYTDLYLAQAGGSPPDELSQHSNVLLRSVSGRSVEVTRPSLIASFGYSLGVTCGDWNQDGFPDIVVGNLGVNELWINQGDGTFRSIEPSSEWSSGMFTASLGLADVDGDALPDIVETNYVDDDAVFRPIEYDGSGKPILLPGPKQFRPAVNRVFSGVGDGTARTKTLGDANAASTSLGLLVTDFDGDGANEIFVANDQNPNQFWDADVTKELAPSLGLAYGTGGRQMACMGVAAADFDGNGRLDLHVTNFLDECSNLYLQNGSHQFVDTAVAFGLDRSTVSKVGFGTQAFDYDNNSTMDLIIGNGHIEDLRDQGKPFSMRTQILSRTPEGFSLANIQGDPTYWDSTHLARGVAITDWNRDGRVDAVVSDLTHSVALLENQTEPVGHWLHVRLAGTKSERDAIGARATVRYEGGATHAQVQTGDGYLCKNEHRLYFGLGDAQSATIVIDWPSGLTQRFDDVPANGRWLLVETQSTIWQD
ncbi:MAG: FG-GAP-like repeat-containing protein [Planctomycetota bacterium]